MNFEDEEINPLPVIYNCNYCKDEGWINDDNGMTSSPCPMNCKIK